MNDQREYFFFSKASDGRYYVTTALGHRIGEVAKLLWGWRAIGDPIEGSYHSTRYAAALRLKELAGR